MRVDLLDQQAGLAVRLLQRHPAALAVEHHPPGQHADEQGEDEERLDEALLQGLRGIGGQTMGDLAVDQRQGAGEQHAHQAEHQQVVQQAGMQARHGDAGQQAAEPAF
ncbi:hypothetical protein D3C78_1360960 [compost metagenome]